MHADGGQAAKAAVAEGGIIPPATGIGWGVHRLPCALTALPAGSGEGGVRWSRRARYRVLPW